VKIKKEQLRRSAQVALEAQGYSSIEVVSGPGIVPGARLRAIKNGEPRSIAVRTSSDREVGLLRTPKGNWRTVSHVHLVLTAVPANDAPAVDVLVFDPNILIEVFRATVEAAEKKRGNKSNYKVPVFVPLDDVKNSRTKQVLPGLKHRAAWHAVVPLGQLPEQSLASGNEDHRARFFENIKQQIADYVGLDISKIDLKIGINP
jgi:hypothetical protein